MKNSSVQQEKISALADGELEPCELDAVLASLRHSEGRKEWDMYHQIGDVIRSDEMAVKLSPDFATRMAARLDAEPVILAPTALASITKHPASRSKSEVVKRFGLPGIAAALAVFTAYLVAPQVATVGNPAPAENFASSVLASASSQPSASISSAPKHSTAIAADSEAPAEAAEKEVVLRDPNIDEYLIAHQRYSPSLYDTTQFVRSATFETEPKK